MFIVVGAMTQVAGPVSWPNNRSPATQREIHRPNASGATQFHYALTFLTFFNHFADAVEGPVNFLAGDCEWRSNANHALVRFLAEYSFVLEGFAVRPRRTVQLDSNPQAFPADIFDIGTA